MQNRNQLLAEEETLQTFKLLAQSYEEISVVKMQRVRSSVLSTRRFLELLAGTFINVKASYKTQITTLMNEKNSSAHKISFSTLARNGKTISVFISSNGKLYGDIISRTFQFFMDAIKNSTTDVAIVGRVGRELFDSQGLNIPYEYFDIPDENVHAKHLRPILNSLIQYQTVNVYFGQFANVVTQIPTVSNVSGEEVMAHEGVQKRYKFFFEPSLETIVGLFEKQIFGSFFKQTIHEAELARLASRIKAMETTLENVDTLAINLKQQMRKTRRLNDNAKQLQSISGISLWKKT